MLKLSVDSLDMKCFSIIFTSNLSVQNFRHIRYFRLLFLLVNWHIRHIRHFIHIRHLVNRHIRHFVLSENTH